MHLIISVNGIRYLSKEVLDNIPCKIIFKIQLKEESEYLLGDSVAESIHRDRLECVVANEKDNNLHLYKAPYVEFEEVQKEIAELNFNN